MTSVQLIDYMTMTPLYVQADSTLAAVRDLFDANSFRHLPVLMDEQVVGIVSQRDVHLAISLAGCDESVEQQLRAADICTPNPYTVDIDTPVNEVVHTMGEKKIGATIITKEGMLAGILTTTDVCKLCAALLDERK